MASSKSYFEVVWSDVSYTVRPAKDFSEIYDSISDLTNKSIESLLESHKRKSYDLQPRKREKALTILHNVSGSFRSGELTAVMGPSGAGKSSLLNLLARRKEKGYSGRLQVRGTDRRLKISAIPQEDYLPPYLTVRENLLISSRCKSKAEDCDHKRAVDKIVRMLDLESCVDTETRRISGGQQKRVSIASELVTDVDILILDEPTSGLDSVSCYSTLRVLKELLKNPAAESLAVVLTIHQPEPHVFDLFDKVQALAPGGAVIFDGSPQECSSYVEMHTGLRMQRAINNPAAFLIEIASGEHGQDPIDALRQQVCADWKERHDVFFCDKVKAYNGNPRQEYNLKLGDFVNIDAKVYGQQLDSHKIITTNLDIDDRLAIASAADSENFWAETRVLSSRYSKSVLRNPALLLIYLVTQLFFPLALFFVATPDAGKLNGCPRFIGEIRLQEFATNDELMNESFYQDIEKIAENATLILLTLTSTLLFNSALAAVSFTLDMPSSIKEFHNGWYSIGAYLTARILIDAPIIITVSTIGNALFFFATGQEAGGSVTTMYRLLIASVSSSLVAIGGRFVGMICGALMIGKMTAAIFVSLAANLPNLLLCGAFVRWKNMDIFSRAVGQLSYMRHGLNLNILARYGFDVCPCKPTDIKEVRVSGVPDGLSGVMNYHFVAMSGIEDASGLTSNKSLDNSYDSDDIFQTIASQIALFNTYGRHIENCDQAESQVLFETSASDNDLALNFGKLFLTILCAASIMFIVVRSVLRLKTLI